MPSLRDIVLARSKEPAKIHSVVRGVELPCNETPTVQQAQPVALQTDDTLMPPRRLQRPRPSPQVLAKPGEAGARCTSQPRGSATPAKSSEYRRPQPKEVPLPRLGLPTPDSAREQARAEIANATPLLGQGSLSANVEGPTVPRQRSTPAIDRKAQRPAPSAAAVPCMIEQREVGRVPKYLRRRQEELAEIKRLANRPASPQPPPGYRRVGEDERLTTLRLLENRKMDLEKAHQSLPMKIETLGQRKREKDLDDRLKHIDRLLQMFGTALVFIPADAEPIQ